MRARYFILSLALHAILLMLGDMLLSDVLHPTPQDAHVAAPAQEGDEASAAEREERLAEAREKVLEELVQRAAESLREVFDEMLGEDTDEKLREDLWEQTLEGLDETLAECVEEAFEMGLDEADLREMWDELRQELIAQMKVAIDELSAERLLKMILAALEGQVPRIAEQMKGQLDSRVGGELSRGYSQEMKRLREALERLRRERGELARGVQQLAERTEKLTGEQERITKQAEEAGPRPDGNARNNAARRQGGVRRQWRDIERDLDRLKKRADAIHPAGAGELAEVKKTARDGKVAKRLEGAEKALREEGETQPAEGEAQPAEGETRRADTARQAQEALRQVADRLAEAGRKMAPPEVRFDELARGRLKSDVETELKAMLDEAFDKALREEVLPQLNRVMRERVDRVARPDVAEQIREKVEEGVRRIVQEALPEAVGEPADAAFRRSRADHRLDEVEGEHERPQEPVAGELDDDLQEGYETATARVLDAGMGAAMRRALGGGLGGLDQALAEGDDGEAQGELAQALGEAEREAGNAEEGLGASSLGGLGLFGMGPGGMAWPRPGLGRGGRSDLNLTAYRKILEFMKDREFSEAGPGTGYAGRAAGEDGEQVIIPAEIVNLPLPEEAPEDGAGGETPDEPLKLTEFPFKTLRQGGAPFAVRAPRIDGNLDDWNMASPLAAAGRFVETTVGQQGKGTRHPSDQKVHVMWDYSNLYIGLHVPDGRITRPPGNGEDWWLGDSVELWIDTLNKKRVERGYCDHQFWLWPDGSGKTPGQPAGGECTYGGPGLESASWLHSAELMPVAATVTDTGWTLEARLSATMLRRCALRAYRIIGFNYVVITEPGEYAYWTSSKDLETYRKPITWGDVVLLGTDATLAFSDAEGKGAADSFLPGEPFHVKVKDPDRNVSRTRRDGVSVLLASDVTGDVEAVTLLETGPDTGVFFCRVDTACALVPERDRVFEVHGGDLVTATYIDSARADASEPRKLTAHARASLPVIELGLAP